MARLRRGRRRCAGHDRPRRRPTCSAPVSPSTWWSSSRCGCRPGAASWRWRTGSRACRSGGCAARGRCLDLGSDDLAFSREETAALLAGDARLDAVTVDELQARTEGWPAGLHLATLVLGAPGGTREQARERVGEISGTTRYIGDYFRETVLGPLSVDAVRFLMRTAVLDRMCASLCDAVLGTGGSAAWLEELRILGLFVVPLDEHGEWFRYRRLFAEMLRGELRRREPREDRRILREASLWYETQDMPGEAIRHADRRRRPHPHCPPDRRAHTPAAQPWAHPRGAAVGRGPGLARPRALPAGRRLGGLGLGARGALGRQALRVAEASSFDGVMPDASASFTSATSIARAALAPDGVERMLADAGLAVALEPPGSPWYTLARVLEGEAQLLTGATREANLAFEQAAAYGRDKQRPGVFPSPWPCVP